MPQLTGYPRARRLAAAFLTAMQAQGFPMGLGHHQSVQELLERLPEGTSDVVLGDSLVALLATSGAEQKLGRDLFRQALESVNAMDAPMEVVEDDPIDAEGQRDLRRLLLRLGGLALVITALVLAYLYRPETEFILPDRTLGIRAGTRTPLPNLDFLTEIGRVGEYAWPGLGQPGAPTFGRLDTIGGPLTYEAPNDTVRAAFTLTLTGTERRTATVKYNIIVLPDTARTPVPDTVDIAEVEPDFSPIAPLPHPRSLADLAPVEAKNDSCAKFFYYAWWPLMAFIGFLLMTGLYLFLRYLQKRKLRLVAQREQSDGAPHFWRIELPELRAGIDWGENYPALLRQLRRRREDDHHELDIKQTISRTIQQGGLPSFHYRSATRPAEYLLLIDRGGANNHHARLFEQLYQQLVAEEILVERYFYDGDPRLLYQNDRAQSTPLTQLQLRLPNARLLVVGSGDRLIHPTTGKLAKWVESQLGTWTSRSILTTLAPSNWGRDERRLAAFFSVLPASMQGLRLLVERINDGNSGEAAIDYRSLVDEAEQAPVNLSGSLIGSLQQSFTTPQLQWIAACALYPTLHWELTLFFGQTIGENLARRPRREERPDSSDERVLSMTDHSADEPAPNVESPQTNDLAYETLLSSQNLLSLSRLPWFINGSIPLVARHELTEWLQTTNPALHRKLRLAMLAVLEQTTPPPAGSVAHRELDFFRLQNEWLLAAPASPERARMAEDLAQRIANGNDPDITVARFMEEPEADAIVLPQAWNDKIYPEGLKGLGVQPEVRRMWWMVPLLALLGILGWWFQPDMPFAEGCKAQNWNIVYRVEGLPDTTLTIQICDKRDSLILAEYRWLERIKRATAVNDLDSLTILDTSPVPKPADGNTALNQGAISLQDFLAKESMDSLDQKHRENVGAMLWNRGIELGDRGRRPSEEACGFFIAATNLYPFDGARLLLKSNCSVLDWVVKELFDRSELEISTSTGFTIDTMATILGSGDLRRSKAFYEQQAQVYQKWLDKANFGQYFQVRKLDFQEGQLDLYLEFRSDSIELIINQWGMVKERFEDTSAIALEEELFYKAASLMEIGGDSLSVQLYDTYDLKKAPLFSRVIYFEDEVVKVQESNPKPDIDESFRFNGGSKIDKITLTPSMTSEGKELSVADFHKQYNNSFVFECIVNYAKQRFEVMKCTDRSPGIRILEIDEVLRFEVVDLCKEVISEDSSICDWLRSLGYNCNWAKRELLIFTIVHEKTLEGIRVTVESNGKIGSGFYSNVGRGGYMSMGIDYDIEFENYADMFAIEVRKMLEKCQ